MCVSYRLYRYTATATSTRTAATPRTIPTIKPTFAFAVVFSWLSANDVVWRFVVVVTPVVFGDGCCVTVALSVVVVCFVEVVVVVVVVGASETLQRRLICSKTFGDRPLFCAVSLSTSAYTPGGGHGAFSSCHMYRRSWPSQCPHCHIAGATRCKLDYNIKFQY